MSSKQAFIYIRPTGDGVPAHCLYYKSISLKTMGLIWGSEGHSHACKIVTINRETQRQGALFFIRSTESPCFM